MVGIGELTPMKCPDRIIETISHGVNCRISLAWNRKYPDEVAPMIPAPRSRSRINYGGNDPDEMPR
jgi:hypothetical protein